MKKETKNKILKILIVIFVCVALALAIYLPLKLTGTLDRVSSVEELKEIIQDSGWVGYLIFFVIQFLQVTVIPIPAVVTTVAGVYVFGPWITFGLSFVSIFLASLVSFFLGRKVGTKIAYWIVGEESTKKWQKKLEKGKYSFFLMMLFPFFPDDILCLVVGATTSMSYTFFIVTNLITRPITIAITCFFGSGQIIPFSGWGIHVWIVLIILAIILFILSIKFSPQIEAFINKLGLKLSKKEKERSGETKEIEIVDKEVENLGIKEAEEIEEKVDKQEDQENN